MPTAGLNSADRGRPWAAWCGLLLQMGAVAGWLSGQGKLRPQLVNDTPSYAGFPFDSLPAALTSVRTPGYPLFLKLTGWMGSDWSAVPTAQMVCYFAAVAMFFHALRRWSGKTLVAFCSASALLYANILAGYVETIATDTLAAAVGIVCGALLLMWAVAPSPLRLVALATAIAAGWLIRPGSVYLAVWTPCLAFWLRSIVAVREGTAISGRPFRPLATPLLLLTAGLGPLGGYVLLRAAVIGEIGVASFDGYNLIGLAGQFVTSKTEAGLSPDQRRIVEAANASRAARMPQAFWYPNEPTLHYLRMEFNHDDTIWKDYVPPAQIAVGQDSGTLNRLLASLAADIIRQQPGDYATWLAKALRRAVRLIASDFVENIPMLLLLLTTCTLFVGMTVSGRSPMHVATQGSVVMLLAVLFLSYALLNIACTIPFVPPRGRLMDGAGVWLPALLGAWFGTLIGASFRSQLRSEIAQGQ